MNQWVSPYEIAKIQSDFALQSRAAGQMASVYALQKDEYVERIGEAHERAYAVPQERLSGLAMDAPQFDPIAQIVHAPQCQLQAMSFERGHRDVSLSQSRVATSVSRGRYEGFTPELVHPHGGDTATMARWRHLPAHPTAHQYEEAQRIAAITGAHVTHHLGVEQYFSHAPNVVFRHEAAKN